MAREARRAITEERRPGASSSTIRASVAPKNRRVPPPRRKLDASRLIPRVHIKQRVTGFWLGLKGLGERLRRPGIIALRVLSLAAALAGLVAVGRLLQHHLTTSPAFAIETIEVQGLSRIERSELFETAGIAIGKNVFAETPEAVRARLLKHPWIASAEVSRKLPGRFDITLREREPVALLVVEACSERDGQSTDPSCDDPSTLYLVSDEGSVFKRLEGEDPVDLPVITGIDRQRFGSDPEFRRRVVLEAVALISAYRNTGLWERLAIGEIHLESNDGFSLYVGDELTLVRLGVPPFAEKLRRMRKVFDRLEREKARAEYVYLDNERRPDRVTVRLR